jgi:hypothetical protein
MPEPEKTLADKIEERIKKLPAHNPAYISMCQQTLEDVLDENLLRHIALEAADVVKGHKADA